MPVWPRRPGDDDAADALRYALTALPGGWDCSMPGAPPRPADSELYPREGLIRLVRIIKVMDLHDALRALLALAEYGADIILDAAQRFGADWGPALVAESTVGQLAELAAWYLST